MSSADPQPTLPWPRDFRSDTFRLIEDLLRSFPMLSNNIKTWRSMEGNASDLGLPSPDMAPYVGLSIIMNPNTILGVDETKINFAMSVQTMVRGTCLEDHTGLWWQIEEAIRLDRIYKGKTLGGPGGFLCNFLQLPPNDPAALPPNSSSRSIVNLRPLTPAVVETNYFNKANDPSCQVARGAIVCFTNRPR